MTTRLLTVGVVVLCLGGTAKASNWKLEKDKNGIKVYTRAVANSALKEFKAVTSVRASVHAVVSIIEDVSAMSSWLAGCKEARTLKVVSPTERYDYLVIAAPFPVSNRDMVIRARTSQDAQTKAVTIKLTAAPAFAPAKASLVRVPKLSGSWRVTPESEGTVQLVYQAHIEAGGKLPDFLANSTAVDAPFKTLSRIKKRISMAPYHAAPLAYLQP